MIQLRANPELKQTFTTLIETMKVPVKWNGIFVVIDNYIILQGEVRSLFFHFDTRKVATNIIDIPVAEDAVEEVGKNVRLQNAINMILYAFGKWGNIKGLKVEKSFAQLEQLFSGIMRELGVEPEYTSTYYRFYRGGMRITYEDVIQMALEYEEETKEADGQSAGGLWRKIVWKRERADFVREDVTVKERRSSRIGNNFYAVGYLCPVCRRKLHMVVYPMGKEFAVETEEGTVLLARAATCNRCYRFYTPRPRKLFAEGDVYALDFEEDEQAYEDYLELLGRDGDRVSNYHTNEFADKRASGEDDADEETLEELCETLPELSDLELKKLEARMEEGFYSDENLEKYAPRVWAQSRNREQGASSAGRNRRNAAAEGKDRENAAAEEGRNRRNAAPSDMRNAVYDSMGDAAENETEGQRAGGQYNDKQGGALQPGGASRDMRHGETRQSGDARGAGSQPDGIQRGGMQGDAIRGENRQSGDARGKKLQPDGIQRGGMQGDAIRGENRQSGDARGAKSQPDGVQRDGMQGDAIRGENRQPDDVNGKRTRNGGAQGTDIPSAVNDRQGTDSGNPAAQADSRSADDEVIITPSEKQEVRERYEARLGVLDRYSERQLKELKRQIEGERKLTAAEKAPYLKRVEEKLAEVRAAQLKSRVDACEGKNYAVMKRVFEDVETAKLPEEMKHPLREKLRLWMEAAAKREVEQLIAKMPPRLDRSQYRQYRKRLAEYDGVDLGAYEDKLAAAGEAAERQELENLIKRSRKVSREDYRELLGRIRSEDFLPELAMPYIERIEDKIRELDTDAIAALVPPLQMTFDEGMEAYQKIEQGDFLPELKSDALKNLTKRLAKIKTDECELLVKKLQSNLEEAHIAENGRHHFYPARKVLLNQAAPEETELIDYAMACYAAGRGPFEYPILVVDATKNGMGKEGMILTPDHLYYSTAFSSYGIPVASIRSVYASTGLLNRGLYVQQRNGTKTKIPYAVGTKELPEFAGVLDEFVKYLQEKPDSRKVTYLASEKHDTICCFRCGCVYKGGNVCPKCGYQNNG